MSDLYSKPPFWSRTRRELEWESDRRALDELRALRRRLTNEVNPHTQAWRTALEGVNALERRLGLSEVKYDKKPSPSDLNFQTRKEDLDEL